MTTFDERQKSFEKKFAMDEELKFRSEQRRNRLLGEWAAGKLGLSGSAVDDYVKALRRADLPPRVTRTCSRSSARTSTTRVWPCRMPTCVGPWPIAWPRP
jgi:hypothetical protein